jgi:methylated-DNA-[protein]-cysteine S-methyltransferase
MKQKFNAIIPSPVGKLGIRVSRNKITGIEFLGDGFKPFVQDDAFVREVIEQLDHYFDDASWKFTLPVSAEGTDFQRRVWTRMRRIPAGKITRYGTIANQLDSSPRAVGGACRANPIPIITPCHRVVSSTGIGGFAGKTKGKKIRIKEWLLHHEQARRD